MKLNAKILLDRLPRDFGAEMTGASEDGLRLRRPILLSSDARALEADRVYVVRASRLPQRIPIGRGAVVICTGDSPALRYYKERCCVIQVPETTDLYTLFNAVQSVFDQLEEWEEGLSDILARDADVQGMLKASMPIFGNPILVMDANFKVVGSTGAELAPFPLDGGDGSPASLSLEAMNQFLKVHPVSFEERGPIELSILGTHTLSVNLFEGDTYFGSLTIQYLRDDYREGDAQLATVLAGKVGQAMSQLSLTTETDYGMLRHALEDMVEDQPLDGRERDALETSDRRGKLICMRLRFDNALAQIPLGYVCTMVETTFQRSIAFGHHRSSVIAFVDAATLPQPRRQRHEELERLLEPFTEGMGMRAGFSGPIDDLLQSRQHFLLASEAIEYGSVVDPASKVYDAQDYALENMVLHSLNGMALSMLLSDGMRSLLAHDDKSPVSYVETLRAYLDNRMSVTATSAELFVHRSTLLERLDRIKRDLGDELDTPDGRLRLQLQLKAMDIERDMRGR